MACTLAQNPGWWEIPAVAAGEVYVLDHGWFSRPGPGLVVGVEILARVLHPKAFSGVQGIASDSAGCFVGREKQEQQEQKKEKGDLHGAGLASACEAYAASTGAPRDEYSLVALKACGASLDAIIPETPPNGCVLKLQPGEQSPSNNEVGYQVQPCDFIVYM